MIGASLLSSRGLSVVLEPWCWGGVTGDTCGAQVCGWGPSGTCHTPSSRWLQNGSWAVAWRSLVWLQSSGADWEVESWASHWLGAGWELGCSLGWPGRVLLTAVPRRGEDEDAAVLDLEGDAPAGAGWSSPLLHQNSGVGVAVHCTFAAVIKCATEIKMDSVRIHLTCVQKHWWSQEGFWHACFASIEGWKSACENWCADFLWLLWILHQDLFHLHVWENVRKKSREKSLCVFSISQPLWGPVGLARHLQCCL